MAAPGGISSLQHTFTTDSLTFTWEAAKDADEYLLTLSRDGAEVATQTVTELTAAFSGLEDGTQYDLAIQASNVQGAGPIAYYQATTGYIAPQPPTNLRQFEERIIAVICRWDHPEPDKVHDTEVQLLYGDELVMADAFDGPETERTFVVPMASTDYLLRVRAGNPGGWSEWAEATVHTEVFPLIDSRLGVMGATYQEDVLHTDTWDGASEQLKGVVETIRAKPGVTVDGYSLAQSYFPPAPRVVKSAAPASTGEIGAAVSLNVSERSIRKVLQPFDKGMVNSLVAVSVSERSVRLVESPGSVGRAGPDINLFVQSAQVKYRTNQRSEGVASPSLSISATESLEA